jgi:uncharacterized protein DUF4258
MSRGGEPLDPDRVFPEDPLTFIRQCVGQRKILWTYHVNMRLESRFIPRQVVLDCLGEAEIIESYPDDKYLPSYFVWSRYEEEVFHILFAVDVPNGNVRVVTAYRPSPQDWGADFKIRRRHT